MKSTSIKIPKDMITALDKKAEAMGGIGRTTLIKIAVAEYLKREARKK